MKWSSLAWLCLGSCCLISLTGCGGGDAAAPAQNNAAAPAGPPPGMMPGMMPGAPGAPGAAAPAIAAPVARDINAFLPPNVTKAAGGKPAQLIAGKHAALSKVVGQFTPIIRLLMVAGLPAQDLDSFWVASNENGTEQALCVLTKTPLNIEALRTQLAGPNAPKDTKVIPLMGALGQTHAVAFVDANVLILGRRETVDAALRQSSAPLLKQALSTITVGTADFWVAGDEVLSRATLVGGLPAIGAVSPKLDKLQAFAMAVRLETPPIVNNGTMPAAPGSLPGQSMSPMGMSPMGMSPMPMGHSATPMTTVSPMPMATATPMTTTPMMPPTGMGHAATPMATPMMSPMANPGGYPMSVPPNAYPAGPGMQPGMGMPGQVATEKAPVIVQLGFVFADETVATTAKTTLDQVLSQAALRAGPQSGRHAPAVAGAAAAPNGMMGMMAGAYPMPSAGPPGAYPMPGVNPAGNAAADPSVPTTLQPPRPNEGARPVVKVIDPPPVVVAGAAPATGMPPGQPGPMGMSPMGAYPMPMGTYPMPGASPMAAGHAPMPMATTSLPMPAAGHSPMPAAGHSPMPGAGAYPMGAYPMMSGPGMAGGMANTTQAFVRQNAAILQVAYRFDAIDSPVSLAASLVHVMQVENAPNSAWPRLHQPLLDAQAKLGAEFKGVIGKSNKQTAGYSWIVPMLPYLNQAPLYSLVDQTKPWNAPENRAFVTSVIPELLNPADPRQNWQGAPYNELGLTHLVGVSGVEAAGEPPVATLPRSHPRAGVFGEKEIAKPEQITDGTSQTMLLISSGPLVAPWAVGGAGTMRGIREKNFEPQTGFSSQGLSKPGAYTLMADGSVRFISAQVDPKVMQAMSTIAGKEQVDLGSLQAGGQPVAPAAVAGSR